MRSLKRRTFLSLAVGFEAGLLVLGIFFGWLLRVDPLGQIQVGWLPLLVGSAATVPLLIGAWWTTGTAWRPVAHLRSEMQRTVVPLFAQCSIMDFLIVSLLAGLAEEILFRGVLQTTLAESAHPLLGLLIASVAFGLAHLITPTYALLAGLIGLYLGLLHFVTQNLFVPIVVHALYDFVALMYVVKGRPVPTEDEVSLG